MTYEFFVAWRYLRRQGRSPLRMGVAILLCSAPFVAGVVLFIGFGLKALGAALLVAGGVLLAAVVLLGLFSTFTAIAMLGLALGIAILTWVLSVTSGFQVAFRDKVLGVNAHVLVLKYGLDFSEYRDVIKKVEADPQVEAAAPFLFNEMMMARGNRLSGVLVKGVDPQRVGRVLALPRHIVEPHGASDDPAAMYRLLNTRADNRHEPAGLIVGRGLASKLRLRVGQPVRLVSPLSGLDIGGWSADSDLPRSRDFRVAAIFDSGFDEYDKRLVYVHMKEVQAFFEQGDVVTGVELRVRDVHRAPVIAKGVLGRLGNGPYRTVDWGELNRNLFTALNIQKLFLEVVVGGFLAVVACFNVVAALAMLIIRKTREIASIKAMGASSWGVARVFQSCGILVWLVGALLGLSCGYLGGLLLRRYGFPLDAKVYLINELPVRMDPKEFAAVAFGALIICLLATLYPAYRAARLDPVVGLHQART